MSLRRNEREMDSRAKVRRMRREADEADANVAPAPVVKKKIIKKKQILI